MSRFSGSQSSHKKEGSKNKGILRAYREQKRIEAELRQEEFEASYKEKGKGMSRKDFGYARHVERLAHPPQEVSP